MGRESQAEWMIEHGYDHVFNSDHTEREEGDEPSFYKDYNEDPEPIFFYTFEAASGYAKKNTGKTITRSPDGEGFIIKENFHRY